MPPEIILYPLNPHPNVYCNLPRVFNIGSFCGCNSIELLHALVESSGEGGGDGDVGDGGDLGQLRHALAGHHGAPRLQHLGLLHPGLHQEVLLEGPGQGPVQGLAQTLGRLRFHPDGVE